jgi:hypothetical protein
LNKKGHPIRCWEKLQKTNKEFFCNLKIIKWWHWTHPNPTQKTCPCRALGSLWPSPSILLHSNYFKAPCHFIWHFKWNCRNPNLGLKPKARACKSAGQEEARESHFSLLGVQKSVREWTLTLPRELPLWELESQWTSEFLESNCRGQN